MRQRPSLAQSISRLCLGLLGLMTTLGGCGLPEYRLNINQLPPGTASIEGGVYLTDEQGQNGSLLSSHFSLAVTGGKDSVQVAVNLTDKLDQHKWANFGVIARDARNCIIGTGSVVHAESQATVADIDIRMEPRLTTVTAGMTCPQKATDIISVERHEQGLYGATTFQLELKGWLLSPGDTITIRSQAEVFACADKCLTRCPTDVTKTTATRGSCLMVTKPVYESPTLWRIEVPTLENEFNTGQSDKFSPYTLAPLTSSPFCVYLKPEGKSEVLLYREKNPLPYECYMQQ